MPISMEIICERCGTLHPIASPAHNRIEYLPRASSEMFRLTCTGCGTKRSFYKNDLRPYSVSPRDYTRGHAEPGEYSQARL